MFVENIYLANANSNTWAYEIVVFDKVVFAWSATGDGAEQRAREGGRLIFCNSLSRALNTD